MDEEDATLREFLNRREWISEEYDGGIYEEFRQRGKQLREEAVANATEPGSTQKKARIERDFDQEIGAGPSAGAASSSDRRPMARSSSQNPTSGDFDMTQEGRDGDETPRAER